MARLLKELLSPGVIVIGACIVQPSMAWMQNGLSLRFHLARQAIFRSPPYLQPLLAEKGSNDPDISDLSNLPDNNDDNTPKLGIDLKLNPLTDEEASELMAAATEVVNDAIAAGMDDLDALRAKLKEEMVQRQQEAARQSEFKAEQEATKLLSKIDRLTDDFLQKTAASRTAVQQAAAADQSAVGKGVELGSWGTLGGASVRTAGESSSDGRSSADSPQLLVLGDPSSDAVYKSLLDPLKKQLQEQLQQDSPVTTSTHKPTSTIPLGGDNAAAILLFLTSWTDASTVKNALDRCWRKTIDNAPPTQIVAISTVGTERTQKMPYSMKNMLSGGQLEKRRQMEEAVMTMAKQRGSIDYTICKVGEVGDKKATAFAMDAGDTLDGSITVDTAATVLAQAMIDPRARNTTLSVVGSSPTPAEIEDGFLRLVGPEIWRTTTEQLADYGSFAEYVTEWATSLAESGKGLTTPVRVDVPKTIPSVKGVQKARSVRLLFVPTATGKNYMSKDEEREREKQTSGGSSKGGVAVVPNMSKFNEGGLEFLAERLDDGSIRARVTRCNYGDDVIVKELSEETILSSFRKSIDVWRKQHPV